MSGLQGIADHVEIEALRGEFTDAITMHDYDRLASLFAQDVAVRMPYVKVEHAGPEQIRAAIGRMQGLLDSSWKSPTHAQSSLTAAPHPARAYSQELIRFRDGRTA
jgi:ketosteroid isomerase-like protein